MWTLLMHDIISIFSLLYFLYCLLQFSNACRWRIFSWACCHLYNFFIVMISQLFTCFLIGLFLSSLLNLKKESQSSMSYANIFSHSMAWFFNFLMVLCILIHFANYFSPESSLLSLKVTAKPKSFRFCQGARWQFYSFVFFLWGHRSFEFFFVMGITKV